MKPHRVVQLDARTAKDARQVPHQIQVTQKGYPPQLGVAQAHPVGLALGDPRRWLLAGGPFCLAPGHRLAAPSPALFLARNAVLGRGQGSPMRATGAASTGLVQAFMRRR